MSYPPRIGPKMTRQKPLFWHCVDMINWVICSALKTLIYLGIAGANVRQSIQFFETDHQRSLFRIYKPWRACQRFYVNGVLDLKINNLLMSFPLTRFIAHSNRDGQFFGIRDQDRVTHTNYYSQLPWNFGHVFWYNTSEDLNVFRGIIHDKNLWFLVNLDYSGVSLMSTSVWSQGSAYFLKKHEIKLDIPESHVILTQ